MIAPYYTPNNLSYKTLAPGDHERLMGALAAIVEILHPNRPDSHSFLCDDMLLWFRNLGFLQDERFNKACEGFQHSSFIRAKLYRVYTYCWAVEQASRTYLKGSFMDFGTYDGKTVQIADRYCPNQTWLLYDAYDHHPALKNKNKHGAQLVDEVRARLPHACVVKGLLPKSITHDWRTVAISFMHVDLNDARAERLVLSKLWKRVVDGGVILLDDYGWSGYAASHRAHKRFFERRGQTVLELPTGQGLVIKRG